MEKARREWFSEYVNKTGIKKKHNTQKKVYNKARCIEYMIQIPLTNKLTNGSQALCRIV